MDFDIASHEGATSRVFVGNLNSDITSKADLIFKFKRYGKVLGVAIHRGYAFVQFGSTREAEDAVKGEGNTMYRGKRIDCNVAADRKSRPSRQESEDDRDRKVSRERDRAPPEYRDREFDRFREFDRGPLPRRDRSPIRDAYDELVPLRRDEPVRRDRDRDPYYDDVPRGKGRPEPQDPYARRPPRDRYDAQLERREPGFRDDPYRDREFSSRDRDDPYRRDPYERDYDRRLPPPVPPVEEFENPIDAEILVVDKQQRAYAEVVERRLKEQALTVGMIFLSQELTLAKALEDVTRRDVLYAIVITSQHELHRSVTLNILHGTPQEHRNMPLEDAMKLVVKNFDSYMQVLREKKAAKEAKPSEIVAPDELTMPQLLNLLADGRQLTILELTRVINHLSQIRQKMMALEGITAVPGEVAPPVTPAVAPPVSNTQELQAKILDTFSSAGGTTKSTPAVPKAEPALEPPKQVESKPKLPTSAGDLPAANLNLDNPNIQKALNSLIQIKPNVLRSLVGSSGTITTPTNVTANTQKTNSLPHVQPQQQLYDQYQPNQQQFRQESQHFHQENQQFRQEQNQFHQEQNQFHQFNQQHQPFRPQQQQPFNGPMQGYPFSQQQPPQQQEESYQQLQNLQQKFYGMGQRY